MIFFVDNIMLQICNSTIAIIFAIKLSTKLEITKKLQKYYKKANYKIIFFVSKYFMFRYS